MSLLSICQNVSYDLGIDEARPPIFGSAVPVARRLFAQARRAAEALHRRTAWSAMIIEHEFTAAGNSDFPLPADFAWMVDDTLWERSRYWALRGVQSPQRWQLYKSSIYGRATIWRRWRIRVATGAGAGTPTVFSIDPPIVPGDNTSRFVFEYVSKNWCVSALNGAMSPVWTSDNDTSILDEWLIELSTRWRMLRRMGLSYDEDQDECDREWDKAVARDGGTAILDLVPRAKRDDFIGQYTLGAFPPVPARQAPTTLLTPPPPARILGQPPPPAGPLLPQRPTRRIPAVVMSDC
jgi:hypothetical protein